MRTFIHLHYDWTTPYNMRCHFCGDRFIVAAAMLHLEALGLTVWAKEQCINIQASSNS